MRKVDREQNGMNFPSLYYPELYLLDGGYKRFYENDSRSVSTTLLLVYLLFILSISVCAHLKHTDSCLMIIIVNNCAISRSAPNHGVGRVSATGSANAHTLYCSQ